MEEVQQQRIVCLPSKVLLQNSVDAGLQDDVVIAGHKAHLRWTQAVSTHRSRLRILHCLAASWEASCMVPEGPGVVLLA